MTQPREDEALIRAGDTSVLLTWVGTDRARKLTAHIVREIPPEVLRRDPEAVNVWTLEELIALKTVIERAETHALSVQSISLRPSRAQAATREAATAPDEGDYEGDHTK